MRRMRLLVCLTLCGVAAFARADSIGTGVLDPVDASLAALEVALGGVDTTAVVKRDLRLAASLRRLLQRKKTAKSAANEASAGATVARKSLGFSASDDEIRIALADAQAAHDAMVGNALLAVDLLLAQETPKAAGKARKRLESRRDRIARYDDLADAADDTATSYKWTAKALRAAGGYVGDGGESRTYVISSLAVASSGLDLNGDGEPDNALAELLDLAATFGQTIDIDQTLADQLGAGGTVTLLEVWSLDSLRSDPFAWFGLTQGVDTDADATDNFTGSETFTYGVGLLPDGHPAGRTPASIQRGRFDVSFSGAAQDVGGLPIPATGRIRVAGRLQDSGATGTFALALPVDAFLTLVETATGNPVPLLLQGVIANTADIDLDGDTTNDAISMAFDFESVPATAVQP